MSRRVLVSVRHGLEAISQLELSKLGFTSAVPTRNGLCIPISDVTDKVNVAKTIVKTSMWCRTAESIWFEVCPSFQCKNMEEFITNTKKIDWSPYFSFYAENGYWNPESISVIASTFNSSIWNRELITETLREVIASNISNPVSNISLYPSLTLPPLADHAVRVIIGENRVSIFANVSGRLTPRPFTYSYLMKQKLLGNHALLSENESSLPHQSSKEKARQIVQKQPPLWSLTEQVKFMRIQDKKEQYQYSPEDGNTEQEHYKFSLQDRLQSAYGDRFKSHADEDLLARALHSDSSLSLHELRGLFLRLEDKFGLQDATSSSPTLAAAALIQGKVFDSVRERRQRRDMRGASEVVIWDPFCGDGTNILEVVSHAANLPVAVETHPFPFRAFQGGAIFPARGNETWEKVLHAERRDWNMPSSTVELLANLTVVGSDTRFQPLAEARHRILAFNEYYSDWIKDIPVSAASSEYLVDKSHHERESDNAITSKQNPSRKVFFSKSDSSSSKIIKVASENVLNSHENTDNEEKLKESIPGIFSVPLVESPNRAVSSSSLHAALTDADLVSFSAAEDEQALGLKLPLKELSLNRTPLQHFAPFVKAPIISTFAPSIQGIFEKKLIRNSRIQMESFGNLLASRSDISTAVVISSDQFFKSFSGLDWGALADFRDKKGRRIRVLKWTGLVKNVHSGKARGGLSLLVDQDEKINYLAATKHSQRGRKNNES